MNAENAKALEDVGQEGYNAGFGEAREAYVADIYRLIKNREKKGFSKGYIYACDVFKIPAEDPKREAPEMPDSPSPKRLLKEEMLRQRLSPRSLLTRLLLSRLLLQRTPTM